MDGDKNFQILIIEDNEKHYQVIVTILVIYNHINRNMIKWVKNIQDARQEMNKLLYKLIICDYFFKNDSENGETFYQHYKEDLRKNKVHFLLWERKLLDEENLNKENNKYFKYLSKNISPHEISKVISEMIS